MLRCRIACAAVSAVMLCLFISPQAVLAETEEQLPVDKTGTYAFYLGEKTPYLRLSPHRSETVDADGEKQPRRISALYLLADLRQFGGKTWDAAKDAGSPAYSGSPTATVRSGTRYVMLSPEQAGMDAQTAAQLRSIAAIAYPFCSAERMWAALAEAGVLVQKGETISAAENFQNGSVTASITEGELLTAVQTAIWRIAGKQGSLTDIYTQTEATGRTARTLEPDPYDAKAASYVQTENNIRAVSDYLCTVNGASLQADMPLTAMGVAAMRTEENGPITLRIRPNGTINADDALVLQVGADSYALSADKADLPTLQPDADGCYTLQLSSDQLAASIPVRLTGTQHTGKDVCLYVPQGGSVDQCLVGAFGGTVEVDLSDTVSVDAISHRVRLRCMTELYAGGSQVPLADAAFSLYLADASRGLTCLADGLVTDGEGLIEVTGLRTPKDGESYVFVQTQAPQGYTIPQENRVQADAASTVRVINEPAYAASAKLVLTDDDGAGIVDVPFELCRTVGMQSVSIGVYQTDSAGGITVEKLPAGNYRFVQQQVPEGYTADSMTHAFRIELNGADASVAVRNFAYRSMEGSVCFERCDPPQSVLVSLLRDGVVCAEQTVSQQTAWRYCFPDIPVLGTYTVVQSPIAGYAAEIVAEGIINRPRLLDVIVRQRSDRNISLRGAVFSLRSADDGTHIRTVASDASGDIRFSDLPVGSYVLCERRAPVGIRTIAEELHLTITDPNINPTDDLPLQAYLESAEGEPINGLCLARRKLWFFGLGIKGILPILTATVVLAAAGAMAMLRRKRASASRIYSGKTKLYLFAARKLRFTDLLPWKH